MLALPAKSGLLSPEELEITSKYDAVALSENLRSDTFSALAVATAFCKRAAIAHQAVRYAGSDCGIALKCFFYTNCLTEIFFDKALTRAKYLDEYIERGKKPVGPLHGVPISLKVVLPSPSSDHLAEENGRTHSTLLEPNELSAMSHALETPAQHKMPHWRRSYSTSEQYFMSRTISRKL